MRLYDMPAALALLGQSAFGLTPGCTTNSVLANNGGVVTLDTYSNLSFGQAIPAY